MSASPFAYEFMRNAFMAATLVALAAGAIGYLLVLRGETFAGHALAHVGFPGATGAALVGLSPLAGLTLFTLAAGVAVGLLGSRARRDVAIGLVLTLSLGLGLLFLHFYTAYAGAVSALLFGNVLGVDGGTIRYLAGIDALCFAGLALIGRPLVFASLQPELAEARGLPLTLLSALFMAIVALAIAGAIQIVGVLLVFALMVAPAATAAELTHRLKSGVLVSMALSLTIAWASLLLAFYTDWPTSFWITALGVAAYLIAWAMTRRRGRAAGEA